MRLLFVPAGLSVVQVSFLLLFPGYFFYHAALGTGLIDPFARGFFTPVALALSPVLLGIYVAKISLDRYFLSRADLAFSLFIVYFLFVLAFQFALGANFGVIRNHAAAVVHFVATFLIFRMACFEKPLVWWLNLACLGGMSAVIIGLSVDGHFDLREQGFAADKELVSTYQGFARSYFLTFLVILPFLRHFLLRAALYAVCLTALFVNGARSELTAVFPVIALVELVCIRHKLLLVVGLAAIAVLLSMFFREIMQAIPDNRILELFDLQKSTSWEARNALMMNAIRTIGEHPLLGDFGSYMREGGAGTYAHNILSAWVDLGLFGFIYLLALLGLPLLAASSDALLRKKPAAHQHLLLALCLLAATLFLLLTSKDFTYMLTGAAVGAYANYRNRSARHSFRFAPPSRTLQAAALPEKGSLAAG